MKTKNCRSRITRPQRNANTSISEKTELRKEDPLAVALRIDDLRSSYCQALEEKIARQSEEIARLREAAKEPRS